MIEGVQCIVPLHATNAYHLFLHVSSGAIPLIWSSAARESCIVVKLKFWSSCLQGPTRYWVAWSSKFQSNDLMQALCFRNANSSPSTFAGKCVLTHPLRHRPSFMRRSSKGAIHL